MRKIFLSVIALFAFSAIASSQCGDELMKQALQAMGSSQYIKDFDIKLDSGNAEGQTFTVVMNSRTMYKFNIANSSSNVENVKLEILDKDKNLLTSNEMNGKVYQAFQYRCGKTAPYKLHVTAGGKESCARAVLSLVEQFDE